MRLYQKVILGLLGLVAVSIVRCHCLWNESIQ